MKLTLLKFHCMAGKIPCQEETCIIQDLLAKMMARKKPAKGKGKSKPKGSEVGDMADLMTQREAADLRGVSVAAIGDLLKRGRLTPVVMFGKTLVRRSEVEALIDQRGWPKGKPRRGGN